MRDFQDLFAPIPLGLMIGLMVLGILLTAVACAPTMFVHRFEQFVRRRQRKSGRKD